MPRGKPKKLITFRLDPDLIAAIDRARGSQERTAWLEEAVRAKLRARPRNDKRPAR